jgi:hypothetical protein
MAPTLVRPPFHRDGWIYEEKVDGWRMLPYRDGARVRLISRNAVNHTARFRELAGRVAKLPPDVLVLDGELAVFDEQLVSRFHLLGDPDPYVAWPPPTVSVWTAADGLPLSGGAQRVDVESCCFAFPSRDRLDHGVTLGCRLQAREKCDCETATLASRRRCAKGRNQRIESRHGGRR